MTDDIIFDSTFRRLSGTWYMKISPELADYLELPEDGETVKGEAMADKGKYGKYAAGWRKDQDGEE